MAYETKDMTGSLFRNNRKEKDTHPDYNGSCRIDGHDMWMSAWLRERPNGEKYFSFAFKRKDGTSDRPAQTVISQVRQHFPDAKVLDDDIPF